MLMLSLKLEVLTWESMGTDLVAFSRSQLFGTSPVCFLNNAKGNTTKKQQKNERKKDIEK